MGIPSKTADAWTLGTVAGPRGGWPLVLAAYVAFAAIVYAIHGPEPALSIDHLTYFKLADSIIQDHPAGDYWRTFNSVRAYGVILAYLHGLTGSHLVSLKLLLAVITVGYLAAFQLFMHLATPSRIEAAAFSLLSALFVSFGASIWGMTDFAASLNRSIIIPFVVVLAWFFFRKFDSPWRYAIYPGLVLISLLHLSALHVFLVFGVFEGLDFLVRRRCRPTLDLVWFAVALAAAAGVQFGMERIGAGSANYVRYTLNVVATAKPAGPAAPKPSAAAPKPSTEAPGARPALPGVETPGPAPAPKPDGRPKPPDKLSAQQAWDIETFAFPWRNMPPSFATLATIAASYGVIFLLALAGAVLAFRSGATRLDRLMVMFFAAVLVAAYGMQTAMWILRNHMAIFPMNFEEIRAVNNVMFPSVYFVYRLYQLAPALGRLPRRAVQALVLAAFALQPIVVLRSLPASWREGIVELAVANGLIHRTDAPRMIYARQFLGLASEGRRFYYSAREAIRWLDLNAGPKDVVLTNVDDFMMVRAKVVGTFLNVISLDVWDLRRGTWIRSLDSVDRIMATGDTEAVMRLARRAGANYAVVTWPVDGAAYSDRHYSIVRVAKR